MGDGGIGNERCKVPLSAPGSTHPSPLSAAGPCRPSSPLHLLFSAAQTGGCAPVAVSGSAQPPAVSPLALWGDHPAPVALQPSALGYLPFNFRLALQDGRRQKISTSSRENGGGSELRGWFGWKGRVDPPQKALRTPQPPAPLPLCAPLSCCCIAVMLRALAAGGPTAAAGFCPLFPRVVRQQRLN